MMLKAGILHWKIPSQDLKRSDVTMDKGSWLRKKGNKINMESKFRRFFFFNQNTLLPAVAEFIQLRYVYIRSNKIYLEKYHYLIKSDFQTKSGVCLRPMQKNW